MLKSYDATTTSQITDGSILGTITDVLCNYFTKLHFLRTCATFIEECETASTPQHTQEAAAQELVRQICALQRSSEWTLFVTSLSAISIEERVDDQKPISAENIKQKLNSFIQQRKSQNYSSNAREFCIAPRPAPAHPAANARTRKPFPVMRTAKSCARVDAAHIDRSNQIKLRHIDNSHQMLDKTTKNKNNNNRASDAVNERISNVEAFLTQEFGQNEELANNSNKPVNSDVYKRLQAIERRLLAIESSYINKTNTTAVSSATSSVAANNDAAEDIEERDRRELEEELKYFFTTANSDTVKGSSVERSTVAAIPSPTTTALPQSPLLRALPAFKKRKLHNRIVQSSDDDSQTHSLTASSSSHSRSERAEEVNQILAEKQQRQQQQQQQQQKTVQPKPVKASSESNQSERPTTGAKTLPTSAANVTNGDKERLQPRTRTYDSALLNSDAALHAMKCPSVNPSSLMMPQQVIRTTKHQQQQQQRKAKRLTSTTSAKQQRAKYKQLTTRKAKQQEKQQQQRKRIKLESQTATVTSATVDGEQEYLFEEDRQRISEENVDIDDDDDGDDDDYDYYSDKRTTNSKKRKRGPLSSRKISKQTSDSTIAAVTSPATVAPAVPVIRAATQSILDKLNDDELNDRIKELELRLKEEQKRRMLERQQQFAQLVTAAKQQPIIAQSNSSPAKHRKQTH